MGSILQANEYFSAEALKFLIPFKPAKNFSTQLVSYKPLPLQGHLLLLGVCRRCVHGAWLPPKTQPVQKWFSWEAPVTETQCSLCQAAGAAVAEAS